MKTRLNCLLLIAILWGQVTSAQSLTSRVDVFLGTGGHGHVYPGATVPFGMVQLSPDNGVEGWDWCSGYHYSSDTIAGFSHTHLSGTGIGDWCDISVMPLLDGKAAQTRSSFKHANEKGRPGYYAVQLDNGINCEMTATTRNGLHRYRFPGSEGWLQFDMGFRINWDKPTNGMVQLINDSTLVGYRYSTGWAKNQRVYFAARFSSPVTATIFYDSTGELNGKKAMGHQARTRLQFRPGGAPLLVRVAISSVSTDKAIASLVESRGRSFEEVSGAADQAWEKELSKIRIRADRATEMVIISKKHYLILS